MTSRVNTGTPNTTEDRARRHFRAPLADHELSFKHRFIPWAGVGLMRGLFATCRTLCVGFEEHVVSRQDEGLASIGCFWHCNILLLTANFFGYPARVLISEHSDGELIAQACLRVGISTVRGSTTRGGARALVQLKKLLDEGDDLIVTPDGPKGPARVFQSGALYLAAKSGVPIIPVGAYGDDLFEFSSWDRFRMPKPFSKIAIRWGEPVFVPREALNNMSEWQKILTEKMEMQEAWCRKQVTKTFLGVPHGPWTLRRFKIKS